MSNDDILTTPLGFAEEVLGMPLYEWQAKALSALWDSTGPNGKVTQIAVSSPNEGGKSSRIVAGAALWWITVHKRGRVAITTKDQKQLNEQIIPAIEKHLPKLEGYNSVRSPYYQVTTPKGGKLIAYVTDDAHRVEGLHSDGVDAPLLWEVDEAKGVEEQIFDGIDRCGYRAVIYTSSPGSKQGTFYDAFTKNRNQFICIKAGLADCPHIDPQKIERIIAKHGPDSAFTLSSLHGEFMEQGTEEFPIPIEYVERCLNNPPKHRPGMQIVFCDFGGATSEHTVTHRDGNKVTLVDHWCEASKEAAANRFIRNFRKLGVKATQIFGDASDPEIARLLSDNGWSINRQNFGSPADGEEEEYVSWGAAAWIKTGIMLGKCELLIDYADEAELIRQLTVRKKKIGSRGRLGIEEKHELAKRFNGSPPPQDWADGFVGACESYDPAYATAKNDFVIPPGIFTSRFSDNDTDAEFAEQMGAAVGS